MALLKKTHMTLGIVAAIATILSLLLTVFTVFFPDRVNDLTSTITGPPERTPARTIRADYVSSQVRVFLYASLVGILLAGAGLGTAYHWSSAQSAGSVARGRGKIRWLKVVLLSVPAVLLVLFTDLSGGEKSPMRSSQGSQMTCLGPRHPDSVDKSHRSRLPQPRPF